MRRQSSSLKHVGELSASLADLGTFLPLVLGVLIVTQMDPVGVLFGFGIFALVTGGLYRRPIPVQPMKAVAAMGIAGMLSADAMVATTVVMGCVLLVLSLSDVITRIRRFIPNSIMHGLKLSLVVSLIVVTHSRLEWQWMDVGLLLIGLIALQRTPLKSLSALFMIVIGMWLWMPLERVSVGFDPSLPTLIWPSLESFLIAMRDATLPQLILTITNALILTAVIAHAYYPEDHPRVTEQRLARSSGWANLLLAPFGAMPMCHGAGGLVAHHAFGGRSGWTMALFGLFCLILGLGFGDGVLQLLAAIPGSVMVMLVLYAAWQIADPKTMMTLKLSCYLVIGCMVVVSVFWGLFPAIVAGWLAEVLRTGRWAPANATN
ncbi:MAG: putative sulfate/molybdate transporter [Litorivicinaceae bacterium]|nr:putative sulfate/molybdate transporter [Litorivicinaceae bacterium]MDP5330388.1 putative sulfate/molybdate transporter [Litorivicinaceae bacterium]